MPGYERLFDGGLLIHHMGWLLQNAENLLHAIPQDQFLNARPEDVSEHIASQVALEPLTLFTGQAEIIPHETTVDVSQYPHRNPFQRSGEMNVRATRLVISIPFTGTRTLWLYRPSTSPAEPLMARIMGDDPVAGTLELEMTQPVDEPEQNFMHWRDRMFDLLGRYIACQRPETERFSTDLVSRVNYYVSERRKRLQQAQGLQDLLGIPLQRNPDAPSIDPVKMTRRLVRPLPPPPKSGYEPEPGIEEADYQHILGVIRHEGRTFETRPATFAKLEEEELRDILLVHLNGHYKGDATGETFRGKGKTDICIEDKSRSAFIAECKIWKGSKGLLEAVDQLLRYLTWRDCKAAIVIFNKQGADFSKLLASIPQTFESHSSYLATTGVSELGEWQFRLASAVDKARQLTVHVFAFDLYVKI